MDKRGILALGGSNSSKSINRQLAHYAADGLGDIDALKMDLRDFAMPIFGTDFETEHGVPEAAFRFLARIQESDGVILSLAEHNGGYTAAFKNTIDWTSRIDVKFWAQKPMLLMAASPGGRGGRSVLEMSSARLPFMGANIVATFSLPSFYDNFVDGRIVDATLQTKFFDALEVFRQAL